MKVGDRINTLEPCYGEVQKKHIFYPATVIYIHPERRFYTVEFNMGRGNRCRQSFFFPRRLGPERSK